MKILFWKHTTQLVSGSDEQLLGYATHVRAAGHHPSVLLLRHHSPHYPQELRQRGVPVSSIEDHPHYLLQRCTRKVRRIVATLTRRGLANLPTADDLAYRTALRVLKQRQPDLIHVMDPRVGISAILRAAQTLGIPVLYQELRTPRDTPQVEDWYEQAAGLLPHCTLVAALSPKHARLCRERLNYPGSICVVPLLVERPLANPSPTTSTGDRVTFGFAGLMDHAKGPDVLVAAVAQARREFPALHVRLAGWGNHLAELQAQARELGVASQCEFIGTYAGAQERSAFMRSIDVFVLPSFSEGTPNSIIEAMSHGLPIVATSVGGIPDVVTPDAGLLVPAGDVAALADALKRLAGDPPLRAAMGSAARARYEQLFSPEAVLPVLVATYQRILEPKSAARTKPAHPWALEMA